MTLQDIHSQLEELANDLTLRGADHAMRKEVKSLTLLTLELTALVRHDLRALETRIQKLEGVNPSGSHFSGV